MRRAEMDVTINMPRAANELGMSFIWTRFLAIKLQIPIGESLGEKIENVTEHAR